MSCYLAKPEHPLDNLVLRGVAGQPGVDVGDDVYADRAEEVITRGGWGHREAQREAEEDGG